MQRSILSMSTRFGGFALLALMTSTAWALDVKISETKEYIEIPYDGQTVRIQRIQDQENTLTGGFAQTSRACPPFCIQPINVAPGVTTLGELELLDFLESKVKAGKGILIDARVPSWHQKGTIPGSINIPFTLFEQTANDGDLIEAMKTLGVTRTQYEDPGTLTKMVNSVKSMLHLPISPPSNWDFSHAKDIALWCNGMWCGQSPHAIRALLKHQYPAEKIYYYRGGMQDWQILGLTVVVPNGKLSSL